MELAVGVVVAGRLLVCHSYRCEQAVPAVYLPVESGLGVEEIECLVNGKALQGIGSVVPFVVVALYAVPYAAVLQVGIYVDALCNAVVGLKVYVRVVLRSVVSVILMVGCQLANEVLDPQYLAEVPAEIAVGCTA